MYALGRDGSSVVVLHLALVGGKDQAPFASFRQLGKLAVVQAY